MREQIRLETAKKLWEAGYSPEEIADEMNVKIKTVKVYMSMLGLGLRKTIRKSRKRKVR